MNACRHLRLLLWKHSLVQMKRICYTILLLLVPALLSSTPLMLRRNTRSTEHREPTIHEAHDLSPKSLTSRRGNAQLKLAYSPDTPATRLIMQKVQTRQFTYQQQLRNFAVVPPDDDENALISRIQTNVIGDQVLAAVVFQNLPDQGTALPAQVRYKLRFPDWVRDGYSLWLIHRTMDEHGLFTRADTVHETGYKEKFLIVQRVVNEGIMSAKGVTDIDIEKVEVLLSDMPYPPYTNLIEGMAAFSISRYLITISALFNVLLIVKDVSQEKDSRMKETLMMMGVSRGVQWIAWFIKHIVFFGISATIFSVMFTRMVGFAEGAKKFRVIGDIDASIFVIFLFLYDAATITFAFAITTLFNKSFHATVASAIIFFGSFAPSIMLTYEDLGTAAKISLSLIPNVAMSFGGLAMIDKVVDEKPPSWSNIGEAVSPRDSFSVLIVYTMLIFDAVFYMCIALYIEAVWPGEYGIPEPWYFPVKKIYSRFRKTANIVTQDCGVSSRMYSRDEQAEYFEEEPTGLKSGIRVCDLRKEFGATGKKLMAVDGFSMSMYEGQITVLLGHNGAGKTTALNMISGLYPPTSGTAVVNECDIWQNISGVRSSLGVCPQHDILFPTLTVNQHLKFFAKIKGVSGKDVPTEVSDMLKAVGLTEKKTAKAKVLSGGMKRRLSAAIALIGGPKVVIFDEPTSGLDPSSRRALWEIMQTHREGRTIVLTTHFMDEADALGDRIAIMAAGKLECCGSPLFLKSKYGAGYHCIVSTNAECDTEALQLFIQERVPDASVQSETGSDVTYLLPMKSKPAFAKLFADIEQSQEQLNVNSFGVSVTTMEEVFIKVGNEAGVEHDENLPEVVKKICQPLTYNTGCNRIRQQYYAYFEKKLFYMIRNYGFLLVQILLPVFILVAQILGGGAAPDVVIDRRVLDETGISGSTVVYTKQHVGVAAADPQIDRLATAYGTALANTGLTVTNIGTQSLVNHWVALGTDDIKEYINNYHIGANITRNINGTLQIITYCNPKMYHAVGISVGFAYNAMAQYLLGGTHSFVTTNNPQPMLEAEAISLRPSQRVVEYTPPNIQYAFIFLSTAFIVAVVREKVSGCRQLQFVSGGSFVPYWVMTFLLDYLIYLVVCSIMVVICAAVNVKGFGEGSQPGELFLLLMAWGFLILPFCYVFANLFGVASSGYIGFLLYLVIADQVATLIEALLPLLTFFISKPNLLSFISYVLLALIPSRLFERAIAEFNKNQAGLSECDTEANRLLCEAGRTFPCCRATCGMQCIPFEEEVFGWALPGIGRYIVMMGLVGLFLSLLLLYLEYPFMRMLLCKCARAPRPTPDEDSDVTAERHLVQNIPEKDLHQNSDIVVREMSKYFRKFIAVNNLSLCIRSGECFGLLGVNGAGKTTTFRMLTGEIMPSSGTTYVKGQDVRRIGFKSKVRMGYCPQFDALIDQLTGREALFLFARLRGIKENLIADVVKNLLSALTVDQHADKVVATYSGGNKRKISMGVAIIGNPESVFLDEPTTGMDPVARRCSWDVLAKVRTTGCIIVLTTHSMEESEALCTRLVIMVNGEFRCLGGLQHLKTKFGRGYTVTIKVGRDNTQEEPDVGPVKEFIDSNLAGSVLEEAHQGMLEYSVPPEAASWSHIFSLLEKAQSSLHIEDYSVNQTTLDQMFMNFARAQSDTKK